MGELPFHGKNTYYERKRIKNGTDQHDEDQKQPEKGLTIGHLECTITVQTEGLRITINELRNEVEYIDPTSHYEQWL
jgi:hypothetical protein